MTVMVAPGRLAGLVNNVFLDEGKLLDQIQRKILIGAMMLKVSNQYPKTKDFMLRNLDAFLEHPRDRALFDLPRKPNTIANAAHSAQKGQLDD